MTQSTLPGCISDVLAETEVPAVLVDDAGVFLWANHAFEDAFGYPCAQLPGTFLSEIIPPALRDAHVMGFSRMLQTGRGTLLKKPVMLKTMCADGTVLPVEAVLIAEQHDGQWQFGATLRPVSARPE